jgi:hypothetical protein
MRKPLLIRLAVLFVHIGLVPGYAATLEPRDLIVTQTTIAATDYSYRYIWLIDRKTRSVRTIDISSEPTPKLELGDGYFITDHSGVVALSYFDPMTKWQTPEGDDDKGWFWSFHERLSYAGCTPTLCPVLPINGAPVGLGSRIISFLGRGSVIRNHLPTVLFDPKQQIIAIGPEGTSDPKPTFVISQIQSEPSIPTGSAGNIEDQSDAIYYHGGETFGGNAPRRLYVPVFQDGKAGVTILNLDDVRDQPKVETFYIDDKSIGTHGSTSPLEERLYLVFEHLWVIDLHGRKLLAKKPLDLYAINAQTSLDGKELYIQGAMESVIQVWDTETLEKITEIRLPVP